MEYSFDEIKNKDKNIPCIIISPGPDLKRFDYKELKGKFICIGDSILRGRKFFKANYWICANNEFPSPNINWHLKIINKFKETFFIFSDTALYDLVWKKSNSFLKKKLKVKWLAYDDRHINKKKCSPESKCCKLLFEEKNKNKLTIQEYVSKMYNTHKICEPFGSTVAEKAVAFSLILGCNPIILQGIDLPEKKIDHNYYEDHYSDKVMSKVSEEIKLIYRNYYIRNFYFKEYYKEIKNKIKNFISNYFRTLFVRPISDVMRVEEYCSHLTQTAGVALSDKRKKELALRVSAKGIDRIPDVGSMSNYDVPWDGMFVMDRLIRWCKI